MCDHNSLTDMSGRIISPRIHYGDGMDGKIECLRCGGFFLPEEFKQTKKIRGMVKNE